VKRSAARAAYVAGAVTVAVVFSPGTALLFTALCGLTVAAARSGGAW
jgi:hypothetical protein